MTKRIGSRNAQTCLYWDKNKHQILCGCFKGDIGEFEKAVETTHANSEHGLEYREEIEIFKFLLKM